MGLGFWLLQQNEAMGLSESDRGSECHEFGARNFGGVEKKWSDFKPEANALLLTVTLSKLL